MFKECGPGIKYIKGPDNDPEYALSRLPFINSDVKERKITREHLAGIYFVENYIATHSH